jgi:large subunit ribosomal protein L29
LKAEEIRVLGDDEIKKQLETAHEELFNLRLRLTTKQLVNHRELPRVKKDIARLMTIMHERKLGIR